MTKWHRVKVKEIGATKIKEYEVDIEGDLNFHTKSKKLRFDGGALFLSFCHLH